jgi:putative ABC transport system permease protein
MTNLPVIMRLAVSTLLENRLRSILTLIGMVFGTAAVIATLSSNDGAKKFITKQLENLGTKLMTATSQTADISPSEANLIMKYTTEVESAVLERDLGGALIRWGRTTAQSKAYAVESSYFKALGLSIDKGRTLDQTEYNAADMAVIIGHKVRENLFGPSRSFVGERIVIEIGTKLALLRVVGAFKEKGGSSSEFDNSVFVSPKLGTKLSARVTRPRLIVLLKSDDQSALVKQQIAALLSPRHGGGLQVSDAREAIERTQSIWAKQNLVGICLAIVSLLTGGVGIMNIMILSIFQRQKEIGLRKAVGAKNSEIAFQFLFETVLICLMGGMIGVLVGWGFGQQVAKMLGDWEAETSLFSVGLALGFSVLTGVLFGLIPAIRASRIDPYDALRSG